jgi:hypothetical protein
MSGQRRKERRNAPARGAIYCAKTSFSRRLFDSIAMQYNWNKKLRKIPINLMIHIKNIVIDRSQSGPCAVPNLT